MAIGFFLGSIAVLACALAGPNSYLFWLLAAGFGCGMTGPGLLTFAQTLAGPRAVGRWYGWQNGFGNLAGVVGPYLTGRILQRTGNFLVPFMIASGFCIVGIIVWVFMVGRVEPVSWGARRKPAIATAHA